MVKVAAPVEDARLDAGFLRGGGEGLAHLRRLIGLVAAEVRAIRPPEPYKGKGIRYVGEKVVIKETKKK